MQKEFIDKRRVSWSSKQERKAVLLPWIRKKRCVVLEGKWEEGHVFWGLHIRRELGLSLPRGVAPWSSCTDGSSWSLKRSPCRPNGKDSGKTGLGRGHVEWAHISLTFNVGTDNSQTAYLGTSSTLLTTLKLWNCLWHNTMIGRNPQPHEAGVQPALWNKTLTSEICPAKKYTVKY